MSVIDSSLCCFTSTALAVATGTPTFVVLEWHGEEGISRPYRFELRLACEQQVLYECMLGERATIVLRDNAQAVESKYHGIVTEVEQLESDETHHYFRVVLEPKMVLLRQCHFSDVWLKISLTALIADIMSNVSLRAKPAQDLPGVDYDYTVAFNQNAAVGDAEFICQFEESSFHFLSRRLEQAGVYYYFEQGEERELLVLCNDLAKQSPSRPISLNYVPMNKATTAMTQAILRSLKRRMTQPVKRVVLNDFNPNIVTGMAIVQGDSRRGTSLESTYVAYGEHFTETATGDLLATMRAQALSCRESEIHGSGRATELRVGATMMFTTASIFEADNLTSDRVESMAGLAGTYFIIEVEHRGSQPLPTGDTYRVDSGDSETHFTALPSDVQYRDHCKTAKPYIGAPISAFIDAEDTSPTDDSRLKGDVADLDKAANKSESMPYLNSEGCYKVRFPFVRASKSGGLCSAFVRMASMSSGIEHGMNLPLLPGAEVLVSFLGGDPDCPIIIGCVPNTVNRNKVNNTNITQAGLSSPLGHFIAMEDKPTSPLMKMGSPAGQSSITFGRGEVHGVNVRTEDHLQLSSSSFKQLVSNVYSLSFGVDEVTDSSDKAFYTKLPGDFKKLVDANLPTGGGSHPLQPAATNADEIALTTKWGGPRWTIASSDLNSTSTSSYSQRPDIPTQLNNSLSLPNLRSKVGSGDVNTEVLDKAPHSVELNTASTQTTASFGARKEVLEDFQSVVYYNYSGEKANINIGKGTYIYDTYRKEDVTAIQVNTTSHLIDTITSKVRGVAVDVASHFYSASGVVTASLSGNKHKITLTEKGVVIEAVGAPILLNGDVVIGGSLLVQDDLLVEGAAAVKAELVSKSVCAKSASINKLESISSSDGRSTLTFDPEALMKKTENTFNSKYGSIFGLGVLSLDRLSGYTASGLELSLKAQHMLLQKLTGDLGSTVKMPDVEATELYKSQEKIKSLSFKVEHARKLYDKYKRRALDEADCQNKIALDAIKWMK